jgi:hypothetical protein
MPTPSALMSNRTVSKFEITLRNLVSDKAFQFSGTDLYLFLGGAIILLSDRVTGSEVFKWGILSNGFSQFSEKEGSITLLNGPEQGMRQAN